MRLDLGHLVFASGKKEVRAIDTRTGDVVWSERLDEFWGGYITLTLHGDTLLAAHRDQLYGFDARTGGRSWKRAVLTTKSGPTMLLSGSGADGQATHAMMAQQQAAAASSAFG